MSFESLLSKCEQHRYDSKYSSYYEGTKRLSQLGVSIPPEIRVLEIGVNWPRLSVDVLVESLTVDGFVTADENGQVTELLRKVWQRNNMATVSAQAHTEALISGICYVLVEKTDGGLASCRIVPNECQVAVETDATGKIVEAMIRSERDGQQWAEVFGLDGVRWYRFEVGRWVEAKEYRQSFNGVVPVIPICNRVRTGDEFGRSEMVDVIPFADAASRAFTNLQLGVELLAMPQRYVIGGKQAVNKSGEEVTPLEQYVARFLRGPAGAQIGQLAGADLNPVINSIKLYAQMVSGIAGIPPSMLGISTDNPSSAEAMRAAKERLIARAECKQALFGDCWESWARAVLAIENKAKGDSLDTLEAIWRDPATPSQSAKNQLVLQAHAQGLLTDATAREMLPLTPEQRAREAAEDSKTRAPSLV